MNNNPNKRFKTQEHEEEEKAAPSLQNNGFTEYEINGLIAAGISEELIRQQQNLHSINVPFEREDLYLQPNQNITTDDILENIFSALSPLHPCDSVLQGTPHHLQPQDEIKFQNIIQKITSKKETIKNYLDTKFKTESLSNYPLAIAKLRKYVVDVFQNLYKEVDFDPKTNSIAIINQDATNCRNTFDDFVIMAVFKDKATIEEVNEAYDIEKATRRSMKGGTQSPNPARFNYHDDDTPLGSQPSGNVFTDLTIQSPTTDVKNTSQILKNTNNSAFQASTGKDEKKEPKQDAPSMG